MRLQDEVRKQVIRVAAGTAALTAVMVLVFVLLGQFDYTVLLGALLGAAVGSLNFLLLAAAVQKVTEETYRQASANGNTEEDDEDVSEPLPTEEQTKKEESPVTRQGRQQIQISHTLRMLMIAAAAVIGWTVPVFHGWATVIPLLFPNLIIALIGAAEKRK